MKKILIITFIIIILIALGVWGYLMFFGSSEAPRLDDFFGDSGQVPSEFDTTFVPDDSFDDGPQNVEIDQLLTQLTVRPVAGAVFLEREGRMLVRYAERGTGHVYDINITSGVESRVSITTEPRTTNVVFAPSGNRGVFTVEIDGLEEVAFVGNIVRSDDGDGSLEEIPLPQYAANFAFNEIGDTLFYTTHSSSGMRGFSRDLNTSTSSASVPDVQLFSIPLRDATVLWDDDATYVYPKPSADANGGLYEIGTSLRRIGSNGNGLMADASDGRLVISTADDRTITSYTFGTTSEKIDLSVSAFPSKCDFSNVSTTTLWCAAPLSATGELPDEWYQGFISFEDLFWNVDLATGDAALGFLFSEEANVAIDAVDMLVNDDDTYAIFRNKNDQTLWLIDLSLL